MGEIKGGQVKTLLLKRRQDADYGCFFRSEDGDWVFIEMQYKIISKIKAKK